MKIKDIKEDMYQYISLRESIDGNKLIDETKRTLINTIESKYKSFFKDSRNVHITYDGIITKNYGHPKFEDLINILIKFKGSEFKSDNKTKKSKKNTKFEHLVRG